MTATQLQTHAAFSPAPRRRLDAEVWLERVLAQWRLPAGLAGRWLASAERHFQLASELVLAAEFDEQARLFTLEIWAGGSRIFGIDDLLA